MNVTLEDAYAESCRALGDAVVRERLIVGELQRLTAENESLRHQVAELSKPESE